MSRAALTLKRYTYYSALVLGFSVLLLLPSSISKSTFADIIHDNIRTL